MLQLQDKWVWDFWFAVDGDDYHMFYLQADKDLQNPDLRHWNVSVGHARSRDLIHWDVLPDALAPTAGNDEAPDSYTTWTGCVIAVIALRKRGQSSAPTVTSNSPPVIDVEESKPPQQIRPPPPA